MLSFQSVPSGGQVDIPSSIPSGMLWRVRKILGCRKEQAVIVPVSGQGDVRNGQRIIFQLPSNSLVDLSTLEWNFEGLTDHGGNADATATNLYVKTRYFPRNIASIIESIDVRINGVSRQKIDNYGLIYNILSDYSNSTDATNKNKIGQNSDPSNKNYTVNGKVLRQAGYPIGLLANPITSQDNQYFSVRQWLGLLGGNGSTSIIHTGILGEITIEIVLGGGGVLMESNPVTIDGADTATRAAALNAAGSQINSAIGTRANSAALVAAQGNGYTLRNIEFRITKYSMPVSFYDALASVLASGQSYQLYFPSYQSFQGIPTATKSGSTRFSIAAQSLDMVIGTFLLPNRDIISLPLLGNAGFAAADNEDLEQGDITATFEYNVQNGSSVLLNNSKYFCRNGSGVNYAKWIVGGAEFRSENIPQMYNGVLRSFGNSQIDTLGGTYPGIKSLGHFQNTFFGHVLDFKANTDTDAYTVSGLDSMANSIDITWEVVGGLSTVGVDQLIMPSQLAGDITCTPICIACTNPHLDIKANREITLYP